MRRPGPQRCECQAPGALQGLALLELVEALQGPGEHHFGPVFFLRLQDQGDLCRHLLSESIDMRLRSFRLDRALEPSNIQVQVVAFQEQFGVC